MIKKIMLMFGFMFSILQAQEINEEIIIDVTYQEFNEDIIDFAYQELVYDFGMLLVEHKDIVDYATAKLVLIDAYNKIPQISRIFDLIMIIDEELYESNITTIDDLIDFEINFHENIAQVSIAWLVAYQNVFKIFVEIHGSDVSFVDWYYDIAFLYSLQGDEDLQDPAYEKLWQAVYDAIQAQKDFENAWSDIE